MKKHELIKLLSLMPDDTEIVLCDTRKNLGIADEDGSSEGLYSEFEIEVMTKDQSTCQTEPFVILSFINEDYDEDGICRLNNFYTE